MKVNVSERVKEIKELYQTYFGEISKLLLHKNSVFISAIFNSLIISNLMPN